MTKGVTGIKKYLKQMNSILKGMSLRKSKKESSHDLTQEPRGAARPSADLLFTEDSSEMVSGEGQLSSSHS